MAKKTTKTTTTEYFTGIKYLQDVHATVIKHKDRIDDPVFQAEYYAAYSAHQDKQIGKFGPYTKATEVTADEFLGAIRTLLALEKVRVYRGGKRDKDVTLNIRYSVRPYGVNVSGDTRLVKNELKAMGFRWNASTLEWWNAFKVAPALPELPKAVKVKQAKAEPVKEPTVAKAKAKAKVKAKKLKGAEAEAAMDAFNAKSAAKKVAANRRKNYIGEVKTA